MHVRINIPAWSARELLAGLAAIGGRASFRRRLRDALRADVRGWEPELFASGRAAIAAATRRLGLEGRPLAVPAYVCPAVLVGLRSGGAHPVPVDCAAGSARFDLGALEAALRDGRIEGVLAANTYGADQPLDALARTGLPVIEDAAYQAGRVVDGAACGTRGAAGVWSFSFKALAGVGGGVLWSREGPAPDPQAAPRARPREVSRFFNYALRALARHHIPRALPGAMPPEREASGPEPAAPAFEGPMSELQAAVALAQWRRRAALERAQQDHAASLGSLAARAACAEALDARRTFAHLFPLLLRGAAQDVLGRRLALRRRLHSLGFQTERPYPPLGSGDAFPNAHDLAARLVLAPCHASLAPAVVEQLAQALERGLGDVARDQRLAS